MPNNRNDLKIKELEKKIAELEEGWKRTQADFMNLKRKSEEDRIHLIKNASLEIVTDLLPILDNFSLAAKHVPKNIENDNWVLGIQAIEKQFESILKDNGLTKISSLRTSFDPIIHEALEYVNSEESEGTIIEDVLPGYLYNEELLRPAKVKVSKGKE